MRSIKLAILVVIVVALMVVLSANMAPVDLHLLPKALGAQVPHLPGVPLAFVIMASILFGLLLGAFIEFIREGKHRSALRQHKRAVGTLKQENSKLHRRLGDDDDDLPLLTN